MGDKVDELCRAIYDLYRDMIFCGGRLKITSMLNIIKGGKMVKSSNKKTWTDKVVDIAESLGWGCTIKFLPFKGDETFFIDIMFEVKTPLGEDFYSGFIVENLDELQDNLVGYFSGFDAEREALNRLSKTPNASIRALLGDMDWVEDKLAALSGAIFELFEISAEYSL